MAQIEVVVVGASAGGLEALVDMVALLPRQLCATILVVVHTRAEATSYLPQILSRDSRLPVSFAIDGGVMERDHIYVAPPDLHLMLSRGRMRLGRGPKENGFRPAVDPLFRSAARAYGNAVIGVILSGALDDGTYGLNVIKEHGGVAIVQDPHEATHPGMPLSALRYVAVDEVLSARDIAEAIVKRSSRSQGVEVMARRKEPDPQHPAVETDVEEMEQDFGPPSGLTCPDCGGALWELQNGKVTRYRCHVGHQFTIEGLDSEQQEAVESALWTAVRILEERAELRKRMAERAAAGGMTMVQESFEKTAHESQQQAHTIRGLLVGRGASSPPDASTPPTTNRKATKGHTRRRRG